MKKRLIFLTFIIIFIGIICYKLFDDKKPTKLYETMKAKIVNIDDNIVTVDAIEEENEKYSGTYKFEITDETDIEYLGQKVDYSWLSEYQTIEITFSGKIKITKQPKIENVTKINIITAGDYGKVVAFIENKASKQDIEKIKKKLEKLEGIKETTYKSKDEIKDELMNADEKIKEILNSLDENPLQDEFIIEISDVDNIKKIVEKIEKIDKVESVKY